MKRTMRDTVTRSFKFHSRTAKNTRSTLRVLSTDNSPLSYRGLSMFDPIVRDVVKFLDFGATRERTTSPTYCNGSMAVQMKKNFSKLISESMDAKIKEWQDPNSTLPAMLNLSVQEHL
ncbi:MAG: hypothetical protein Q9175_006578 [Cornicularia normoerica]